MKKNISRNTLAQYLDNYLRIAYFKDYCPNGLQVQGKEQINKIIGGVTASKALIEKAIEAKADAIMVHHGWFWKNDDMRIVGQLHDRLSLLMKYNINLFAFHLPLDSHPEVGNNAQLGKKLRLKVLGQHPQNPLIWYGEVRQKMISLEDFSNHVCKVLNRQPMVIGDLSKSIQRVAWCTGAAQNYFREAIELNIDAYISGEISEPTFHLAQESGIAYLGAGHHATERFGILALGNHLEKHFGLEYQFIDIPNPV